MDAKKYEIRKKKTTEKEYSTRMETLISFFLNCNKKNPLFKQDI